MRYGQTFTIGCPAHWAALGLVGASCVGIVRAGLATRGDPARAQKLRSRLAIALAMVWVVTQGGRLLPTRLKLDMSLPLQTCNMVALFAPLALSTRVRYFRAVLFFFGFGICPLALVLPVLRGGLARPEYWNFWMYHDGICVAAVYDLVVGRYRPTFRDWGYNLLTIAAFTVTIFAVDVQLNADYAFLGLHAPAAARAFGEWPLRVLWIALTGVGTTFGLWLAARPALRRPSRALLRQAVETLEDATTAFTAGRQFGSGRESTPLQQPSPAPAVLLNNAA